VPNPPILSLYALDFSQPAGGGADVQDVDMGPRRVFVREGSVMFFRMEMKQRYFFLLSDLLIVGKPKTSDTFKLKATVKLQDAWVHPSVSLPSSNIPVCGGTSGTSGSCDPRDAGCGAGFCPPGGMRFPARLALSAPPHLCLSKHPREGSLAAEPLHVRFLADRCLFNRVSLLG
jgi:hypothetical protein